MLLSYNELVKLVEQGVIDADPANINAASIDIRLGHEVQMEGSKGHEPLVDLLTKQVPNMVTYHLPEQGIALPPGAFALAHSLETFNLPDDIACEFKLRSSIARAGMNALLAGWCDPGWHGAQLTLELHNTLQLHHLILKPGLRIGQMVFFRCEPVPKERSYASVGRYNGQQGVQASLGA